MMAATTNRGRVFPPQTVADDETRRLLDACNRGATGARNRALLVLLREAGLRVGEAVQLRMTDLDFATGAIRIRAGKRTRGKRKKAFMPRTSAVTSTGAAVLQEWIRWREQHGIATDAPFLCTLAGEPLWTSYVRALCARLARRAGIAKRVHPHAFRHSFAADLARRGLPMNAIQAALGHKSLATTGIYLAHVAPDELVAMLRAAREPQTTAA
jgi:site-specific recombinase XerD